MITSKKLICGDLFYVHFLRSWLERQQTCHTCRALVAPPENGTIFVGVQQGSQSNAHRQGNSNHMIITHCRVFVKLVNDMQDLKIEQDTSLNIIYVQVNKHVS